MRWLLVAGLFLLSGLAGTCWATEGGSGAYSNGAEDFSVGYCVRPGVYFTDYLLYMRADRFNDDDGKSAVPDFEAEVVGNGFKFLYITDRKLLGGNWAMHATIPVASVTVKAAGTTRRNAGLGDIVVNPLIVGWCSGNLYYAFGTNVYLPTASRDKTKPRLGRGYYTFGPFVAATYRTPDGLDLSGILYYDFNTRNNGTGYLSGQEAHIDYSLAKSFGSVTLGAGGYYYQQVTGDRLYGKKAGVDGNKGQVFAIGPEVRYAYKKMRFTLKHQVEVESHNRPQGSKTWFKFNYIF